MDEKRLVDGTTALAEKQPRVIKIEPTERPQNVRLRVAAYTRVSSDSEDQLNSFAAQNRYYTELISSKAEWRMVDIYADEGITGTSVTKRDDFQRMMADCRRGLIDQILVKSISRFARNTKDCLQNIRELKELGVNVRFEREGIDTINVSSELITAIYAAFAQKESESISGNMRWSYQRRMEQGAFNTYHAPVGFTLIDGDLQVNQAEVPTIQRIFTEYLSGNNSREIAAALNKDKALGRRWRREAIDYILQNERYAGNALLQKRYTTDSFPREKKRNRGEREKFFVFSSNEAIISQEMFDQAQQLRKTRKRNFERFKPEYFPEQAQMEKQDIVICAGDFGGVWFGDSRDDAALDWLESLPFTLAFVCGNHENYDALERYPVDDWHGGKVHRIRPHVLHLMRGQIFELEGYHFFIMGGAKSHDTEDGILEPGAPDFERKLLMLQRKPRARYRINHISWWAQEMPSEEEYAEARKNLAKVDWAVDYVITHCAPTSIALMENRHNEADPLTDFLQEVKERAHYHYWLFGHYHDNRAIDEKHILLWEQIVQVI